MRTDVQNSSENDNNNEGQETSSFIIKVNKPANDLSVEGELLSVKLVKFQQEQLQEGERQRQSQQEQPLNNYYGYYPYVTVCSTFEDYFRKPNVQKIYYKNILTLQFYISLLCFLVSFVCTVISNQQSFLDSVNKPNDHVLISSLLVNTFLLLLFGSIFSVIAVRVEQLNHYPWFLLKIIIETLIRMYQTGLVVFWVVFLCEKFQYSSNESEKSTAGSNSKFNQEIFENYTTKNLESPNSSQTSPFYFGVCLIYGLNLTLYLSLTLWLRCHKKAVLNKFVVHIFSFGRICTLLMISVPCIFIARSNHPTWNISQVLIASLCGILDGTLIAKSYTEVNTKSQRNAPAKQESINI